MKFIGYHHEKPPADLGRLLARHDHYKHKVKVWNTFVDSELPGITDDDFSILPRVLPYSYWPTLKKSIYLITKFTLKLLSLPEKEIRAIVPRGPVRDHLLDKLQVLRHRSGRIVGSYRYDLALVGPLDHKHPPQLLELNEIGFDGLARSSYFQKTLLDLMPEFKKRLISLDTAAAEIRNMRRVGNKLLRIQYADYNWDELYMHQTAQRLGFEMKLVSPGQFGLEIAEDCPLLEKSRIDVVNGRVSVKGWRPDAVNMSFAYDLKEYLDGHSLYRELVKAKTPQYGSFLTGLVAAKTILVLLDDPLLRKRLMGDSEARELARSILPARLLPDALEGDSLPNSHDWVLKHTDGCGGELVFMNRDLEKRLRKIRPKERHEWVVQKKTKLNLIDVNGIRSRPKTCISDLGVFVQYDWAGGKFQKFEIGGLMCRATNRSLKVNVSGGGLQVAVLMDRAR